MKNSPVKKDLKSLPADKATAGEIPITFPDNLKLSHITPVHKKPDPSDKTIYRPVPVSI